MIGRLLASYFGMAIIAIGLLAEAKLNGRVDAPWWLLTSLLWAPAAAAAGFAIGFLLAQIGPNLKRRISL